MSKKTLLLIILLTIITAGLLILAISSQKEELKQITTTTPTVSPVPNDALLSLIQNNQTTTPGIKAVDLALDTGATKVTAVQMELAYDPNVLTNITVVPGSFIQNPVILFNEVDKKNGRISFAVGISSPDKTLSGKGVIATIKYSILPTAKEDTTTLHFLSKTGVSAEGIRGTVLKNTTDLNIPIKY